MAVLSTANTALTPSTHVDVVRDDEGLVIVAVVVAVVVVVAAVVVVVAMDVAATFSLTMVIIFCMMRGKIPPNSIYVIPSNGGTNQLLANKCDGVNVVVVVDDTKDDDDDSNHPHHCCSGTGRSTTMGATLYRNKH